jgi:hypothetical protein
VRAVGRLRCVCTTFVLPPVPSLSASPSLRSPFLPVPPSHVRTVCRRRDVVNGAFTCLIVWVIAVAGPFEGGQMVHGLLLVGLMLLLLAFMKARDAATAIPASVRAADGRAERKSIFAVLDGTGFDLRLQLTARDLERFGPAVIVDHTSRDGSRLLVWTGYRDAHVVFRNPDFPDVAHQLSSCFPGRAPLDPGRSRQTRARQGPRVARTIGVRHQQTPTALPACESPVLRLPMPGGSVSLGLLRSMDALG